MQIYFQATNIASGYPLTFSFFYCFRHEIAYAYVYSNPTICGFLDCLHGKDFKHMYSSPAISTPRKIPKEKVSKRCQTPYPLKEV